MVFRYSCWPLDSRHDAAVVVPLELEWYLLLEAAFAWGPREGNGIKRDWRVAWRAVELEDQVHRLGGEVIQLLASVESLF